jgi:hypothetical protein
MKLEIVEDVKKTGVFISEVCEVSGEGKCKKKNNVSVLKVLNLIWDTREGRVRSGDISSNVTKLDLCTWVCIYKFITYSVEYKLMAKSRGRDSLMILKARLNSCVIFPIPVSLFVKVRLNLNDTRSMNQKMEGLISFKNGDRICIHFLKFSGCVNSLLITVAIKFSLNQISSSYVLILLNVNHV